MRYVANTVSEALADRKMAFIAGPRQVGKTTFARSLLQDPAISYFTWDLETHRRRILHAPAAFWTPDSEARIVLDEIHKYPRWKRFLKGVYDTRRDDVEIIVTGSGRLDVYQKGGDSLLGRFALSRLHPFTVGELLTNGRQTVPVPADFAARLGRREDASGATEALERIERFTGFPEPLHAGRMDKLRSWRRSRRDLVLREDLRDLTRIRELGLIDQLAELLPERVGSPLSVNALREDLGVAFDTVKGWLEALQRLYYLFELRPYAGKLARTLRREAKIYLYDYTRIEDEGHRFENVVALHMRKLIDAWNDRGDGDFALWYVRDKERREVDFLITDGRKPWLLAETKLTDGHVSPALRHYRKQFSVPHAVQIVRRGVASHTVDGIAVVNASDLLARM
jgi:predicted AAA+ superfamily ATPase